MFPERRVGGEDVFTMARLSAFMEPQSNTSTAQAFLETHNG